MGLEFQQPIRLQQVAQYLRRVSAVICRLLMAVLAARLAAALARAVLHGASLPSLVVLAAAPLAHLAQVVQVA